MTKEKLLTLRFPAKGRSQALKQAVNILKSYGLRESGGFYECEGDFQDTRIQQAIQPLSKLKHASIIYEGNEIAPKKLKYVVECLKNNERCDGICSCFLNDMPLLTPNIMNCFESVRNNIGYMYDDQLHFFGNYLRKKSEREYELDNERLEADLRGVFGIYFEFCPEADLEKCLGVLSKIPQTIRIKFLDPPTPDSYEALIEKGSQFEETEDGEKAVAAYKEAIELDPDREDAYSRLFSWYYFNEPEATEIIVGYAEKCIDFKSDSTMELEMLADYYLELEKKGEALWTLLVIYKIRKKKIGDIDLERFSKLVQLLQEKIKPINPTHLKISLPKPSLRKLTEELKELQKREEEWEFQREVLDLCKKALGSKRCPICNTEYVLEETICYDEECPGTLGDCQILAVPGNTYIYELKKAVRHANKFLVALYPWRYIDKPGKGDWAIGYQNIKNLQASRRESYFYMDYLCYVEGGVVKWKKCFDASVIIIGFTSDGESIVVVTSCTIEELKMLPLEDLVVYRKKVQCAKCGKIIVRGTPCWRGNVLLTTDKEQIQLLEGPPDHPQRVARICLECRPLNANRELPIMLHLYQIDLSGKVQADIPIRRLDGIGTTEPYYFGSGEESISMKLLRCINPSRFYTPLSFESINTNKVILNFLVSGFNAKTQEDEQIIDFQISIDLKTQLVEFNQVL